MYNHKWANRIVDEFSQQFDTRVRLLLRILGKNRINLVHLFQNDQKGWEDFKFIVKSQLFAIPEIINIDCRDYARHCAIRMYSMRHNFLDITVKTAKFDWTGFFIALYS
jgi:hypothetical protein